MLEFHDVVVTPFTDLMDNPRGGMFHRGGPRWPDWASQIEARHCAGGSPVDQEPVEPSEAPVVIDEPWAWGAPLVNHFGHQVADFSTRLLETSRLDPAVAIAFSSKLVHTAAGVVAPFRQTPYFNAILDWYDIPQSRVHMVDMPLLVRNLWVAPQSEQRRGPGPRPDTLDALDEISARKIASFRKCGPVFVSRSQQRAPLAGEAYLDQVLVECGVGVIHPETLPLIEQLSTYATADPLIFTEGSAIHGVQLLGRGLGAVYVINRRPGYRLAEETLQSRVRSLDYVETTDVCIHGVNLAGAAAPETGIGISNADRLVAFFEAIGIRVSTMWRKDDFAARLELDFVQWLERELALPRSRHANYWPLVKEQLELLRGQPSFAALQRCLETVLVEARGL